MRRLSLACPSASGWRQTVPRTDLGSATLKIFLSPESYYALGYAPSLTVDLLPNVLRDIRSTNPGLRIQLHDLSTAEMLCGLREDRLHVALLIETPGMEKAGLIFEELGRYAVRVAVHRAHPLAGCRKVGLQQIVAEPLIAYTLADYPEYRSWLDRLFAPLQHPALITEEYDSAISLIASVEAGRGIALVQEGFQRLSGKRLKILPLIPAPPPFVVGMAYHKKTKSPATQHFIAAVRKAATG
jgi:DNA-binding transcriptional LysR family regulator